MHINIESPQELGMLIRAVRKTQGVRSDDLAATAGVGPVFVIDVERGKPTVQIGKVFQLLAELGIRLHAEIPVEQPLEGKLKARSDLAHQSQHPQVLEKLVSKLQQARADESNRQIHDVSAAQYRSQEAEISELRGRLAEAIAALEELRQSLPSPGSGQPPNAG